MIDYLRRTLVIFILYQSAACAGQQNEKIDLSQYDSSSPIEVITDENALQVVWQSADDTKFRVDFNLSDTQPLINKISVAKNENSSFEILAEKIHPDFQVTIGIRDAKFDVNWPWIFFDDPFRREFKTYPSVINLNNVEIQSTEGRVKITFSSITSGAFHGDLVCHIFSGSPLIYWEAVMTTDQPKVAYLYDTRFHTKIPKPSR